MVYGVHDLHLGPLLLTSAVAIIALLSSVFYICLCYLDLPQNLEVSPLSLCPLSMLASPFCDEDANGLGLSFDRGSLPTPMAAGFSLATGVRPYCNGSWILSCNRARVHPRGSPIHARPVHTRRHLCHSGPRVTASEVSVDLQSHM